MTEIPLQKYLPRAVVLTAVGGKRALARHEAEGELRRYYPAGMRRARYLRKELLALLDGIARPV
jgi:hypothetical protein